MKVKILYLLVCSLSLFLFRCDKLFPDEKLTLQRTNYYGNKLRLDGYYYCYYQETDITVVYFLFRNGIIRCAGGYSRFNEDNREQEMVSYYHRFTPRTDWGVFIIERDKIQYEKWIEGPSGVSATINRCSGYIENDTTFHITESYYSGTKETEQMDKVYHFKHFVNKPDSTNTYIK